MTFVAGSSSCHIGPPKSFLGLAPYRLPLRADTRVSQAYVARDAQQIKIAAKTRMRAKAKHRRGQTAHGAVWERTRSSEFTSTIDGKQPGAQETVHLICVSSACAS